MVYRWRLGLLMVFSFIAIKGSAQAFNPKQTKLFRLFGDTIVLDTLSLVPGSLHFKTYPAGDSLLLPEINYRRHALIFKKSKKPDSILVSYKRFPYNFEKLFFS